MPILDAPLPQRELDLVQQALDALRNTAGLNGRIVAAEVLRPDGRRVDAIIEIKAEGQTHKYTAEIKRVDRFAALGTVKQQIEHYDPPSSFS